MSAVYPRLLEVKIKQLPLHMIWVRELSVKKVRKKRASFRFLTGPLRRHVSDRCDSGQNKTNIFIKLPFLPPISVLPLCQSAQSFQPLATRAEAWQAIPGVTAWVMNTVRRGYSLQIARSPPRFRGVLATSVRSDDAHVLRVEVMNLLEKGAIEIVLPAQSESGFYSRYVLVPKKDGGLRPILDLRLLNHALMKRQFRMITLKQIILQICLGDWFMSLDLKDTYFHFTSSHLLNNELNKRYAYLACCPRRGLRAR